jgi:hypothetical protein
MPGVDRRNHKTGDHQQYHRSVRSFGLTASAGNTKLRTELVFS